MYQPEMPWCALQATAQAVEENATGTEQKKLWGGRFTGATDPLMEKFNESLPFDKRMWREDLMVQSHRLCLLTASSSPFERSELAQR